MNLLNLKEWIDHPLIVVTGWTLLHFVWQGLGIAVVTGLGLAALRRQSAASRYLTATLGLGLMALCPLVTWVWLVQVAWPVPSPRSIAGDVQPSLQPYLSTNDLPIIDFQTSEAWANLPAAAQPAPAWTGLLSAETIHAYLPWGVAGWCLGVGLLSLRFLGGLWTVRQWKDSALLATDPFLLQRANQLADRLGLTQAFELRVSPRAMVPAVIGWWRPAVLVPASLLTGMAPAELESLLAHELAHIRRHDYLVNLLQTMVETLLFYHPGVWWLSRVMRIERELCCDDLAIAACGDRTSLARALAFVEQRRCAEPELAMSARRGSVLHRIQRMVQVSEPSVPAWWPASCMLLVLMSLGLAGLLLSANSSTAAGPATGESNQDAAFDETLRNHQPEVERLDAKTGQSHQVLAGVAMRGPGGQVDKVDMKYANLFPYTFIPERLVKSLGLEELGVLEFGQRPEPANPNPLEIPLVNLSSLVPPPPNPAERPGTASKQPGVFVDDLTEPVGDRTLVPYDTAPLWIPDHLAFYGLNRTGQTRFRVVRIPKVALGLGPSFGPVNALVLDDANSDLGVLGLNWTRRLKGPQGEGFAWAAAGGFYWMTLEGAATASPSADWKPVAEKAYDSGTRVSQKWLTVEGVQVPVDESVGWQGIQAWYTLMQDLVVTEEKTGNVLWLRRGQKGDPNWNRLRILRDESRPNANAALLEIEAADGQTRKRFQLLTGVEVAENPAAPDPSSLSKSLRFQQESGIQTATVTSPPGDRFGRERMALLQQQLKWAETSVAEQETLVEAQKGKFFPSLPTDLTAGFDAEEVLFSLPEGSGIQARVQGTAIEQVTHQEEVELVVTSGRAWLLDANGVVRAEAWPDGGAEQLVVRYRLVNGEPQWRLSSRWLDPKSKDPPPPVVVKLNANVGAPADEPQPPHGAIRFRLEIPSPTEWARMKMIWHYHLNEAQTKDNKPNDQGEHPPQTLSFANLLTPDSRMPPEVTLQRETIAQEGAQHILSLPEGVAAEFAHQLAESSWGRMAENSGLKTRLTLQSADRKAGQPLLFKLEITNGGQRPTEFDPQDYTPFRVLRATDGQGKLAPFIGAVFQTSGSLVTLEPGEVQTLWENVDATRLLLLPAGDYDFVVEGGEWAKQTLSRDSNEVHVKLEPGELPPQQRLLQELIPVLPENWQLMMTDESILLTHLPTQLKRDATVLELKLGDAGNSAPDREPSSERVNSWSTPLGTVTLRAPARAQEIWPDHLAKISAAVSRLR